MSNCLRFCFINERADTATACIKRFKALQLHTALTHLFNHTRSPSTLTTDAVWTGAKTGPVRVGGKAKPTLDGWAARDKLLLTLIILQSVLLAFFFRRSLTEPREWCIVFRTRSRVHRGRACKCDCTRGQRRCDYVAGMGQVGWTSCLMRL